MGSFLFLTRRNIWQKWGGLHGVAGARQASSRKTFRILRIAMLLTAQTRSGIRSQSAIATFVDSGGLAVVNIDIVARTVLVPNSCQSIKGLNSTHSEIRASRYF